MRGSIVLLFGGVVGIAVLLGVETGPALGQEQPAPTVQFLEPTRQTYLKLAEETEQMLRQHVLGVWFPRCVDKANGGFHANFDRQWNPTPSDGKFSVFQGRMTWIAAQVAHRRPDLREQYLPIAQHGVDYLDRVMWDTQAGGVFWGLDEKGQITAGFSDNKHLYGASFCLYGAAAAYQATKDPKALDLAQRLFRWMDDHAHDSRNGGYFEWLTRDGKVIEPTDPDAVKAEVVIRAGFPIGYKSMNTHIHLLESFTQLYQVWKDETLRQRLEELFVVVRDKVCVQPGVMNLYFTYDWRPIPDHDSYGHDVETAFLLLEAAEALGHVDEKTERMARKLVDHALAYGWDVTYGGFYADGTTFGKPEELRKDWWVQVEGLNALLLMHEKYGRQTDQYFRAFQQQWRFIQNHQIDKEYGGMYTAVEADGTVKDTGKAQIWKAAYHDGRALLNVTDRLRKLAGKTHE